jgi:hypothetical protein
MVCIIHYVLLIALLIAAAFALWHKTKWHKPKWHKPKRD